MIKTKKYRHEINAHISIDPSDEKIVIVSGNGRTQIWVNGKEIEHIRSVTFSHNDESDPVFNISIDPN